MKKLIVCMFYVGILMELQAAHQWVEGFTFPTRQAVDNQDAIVERTSVMQMLHNYQNEDVDYVSEEVLQQLACFQSSCENNLFLQHNEQLSLFEQLQKFFCENCCIPD